jgi:hypothetical protein
MNNIFGKISHIARAYPFFWVLVPVFFMLKNENTYFTAVPFLQSLELLALYLAGSCALYGILRLFIKRNDRVALSCFIILTVYFFYGSFDHWLQAQKWLYPFPRYRWSLPVSLLLITGALMLIGRMKKAPARTIAFLNCLLILFCCSSGIPMLYKSPAPKRPVLTIASQPAGFHYLPAPPAHPDIYFLVFDEYQGNAGLQTVFHYENHRLKNALAANGFFSPAMTRSNYNFTFFSMASILNMDYIQGEIQGRDPAQDVLLLSSGLGLIQDSRLIGFLKNINYTIVNLSPFRLDSSEDRLPQFESVSGEKDLISRQTLYNTFKKKFGWMTKNIQQRRLLNPFEYNNPLYNDYVRNDLLAESAAPHKDKRGTATPPKFVYAHLFLPHLPFGKDSSGNEVDIVGGGAKQKNDSLSGMAKDRMYLDYLKYANTVIINAVDTLIKNDPGAIIMIMSDHGYRGLGPQYRDFQYNNLFHIRIPGKSYADWPDTVDGVNAFRLLLNHAFGQQLPYLSYRKREFQLPCKQGLIY